MYRKLMILVLKIKPIGRIFLVQQDKKKDVIIDVKA